MYDYIIYNGELYHYGVKGMRWGHRKRQAFSVSAAGHRTMARVYGMNERAYKNSNKTLSSMNAAAKSRQLKLAEQAQAQANVKRATKQAQKNTPEYQQKAAKRQKAIKVGVAVAGTALAAYGGYKLAKFAQDKRQQAAMQKASDYLDKHIFNKVGDTTFRDGTRQFNYVNGRGDKIVTNGARGIVGKDVGRANAKTVATARQMYKDATNTKLDKGLAKVVNTGDAIGNTAKRGATSAANATKRAATSAANTVKTSANKAKNSVLDVVNPIYEYKPGATTTNVRKIKDIYGDTTITESVTDYYKIKKKRK